MMWNEARNKYADWKQQKAFLEGAMFIDKITKTEHAEHHASNLTKVRCEESDGSARVRRRALPS